MLKSAKMQENSRRTTAFFFGLAQMKFAIFCWTHRGNGRPAITADTDIETAIAISKTIRVQYESACSYIRYYNGEIIKVFLYEDRAHYPTKWLGKALMQAVLWCRREDLILLVCNIIGHRGRHIHPHNKIFPSNVDLSKIQYCLVPSDLLSELDSHFSECFKIEKRERLNKKRERLNKKISRGLVLANKLGNKTGFASDWSNKNDAAMKGRASQKMIALNHSLPIVDVVSQLLSEGFGISDIVGHINALSEGDIRYKPRRAELWTTDSLRMFFKRHSTEADSE